MISEGPRPFCLFTPYIYYSLAYIVLLHFFILHRKLYLAWPRNRWSFRAGPDHMDSSLAVLRTDLFGRSRSCKL